jgi:hypothetical protein
MPRSSSWPCNKQYMVDKLNRQRYIHCFRNMFVSFLSLLHMAPACITCIVVFCLSYVIIVFIINVCYGQPAVMSLSFSGSLPIYIFVAVSHLGE